MNSWSEVVAVLRKELQSELRTKTGLMTSGLFGIVAVVAISFATFSVKVTPTTSAGLFWVTLLFSSMISLPRAFTIEEEVGTGDLLRLVARPHSVFWGKALFNLILLCSTGAILSLLFTLLAKVSISSPGLFIMSMAGSCISLASGVTLCGALFARADNRNALSAIALPLLLPLTIIGVGALRVAFGEVGQSVGQMDAIGLLCYGVASTALGPYLFAAVWKS